MEKTSVKPTQPVLNQNLTYRALYKILSIFLLVSIAFAAGYYYSFKESEQAKRSFFVHQQITRESQAQVDKKIQTLKPVVQFQKAAEDRKTEPDKKDAPQPMAKPASLSTSQMAALPAQPLAKEKKVMAPSQNEATEMYCVNVGSFKLLESADFAIKDLQKKGYDPAADTIKVTGTTWYRVTLGHFQTQREAQNYAKKLQNKDNIEGFVVRKE